MRSADSSPSQTHARSSHCKGRKRCHSNTLANAMATLEKCEPMCHKRACFQSIKGAVLGLAVAPDRARASVQDRLDRCGEWRLTGSSKIIELVSVYGMEDETAVHAMTFLDRFIEAKLSESGCPNLTDALHRSECIAIACFLLATKMKEISSPCVRTLLDEIGSSCTAEEILLSEQAVLTTLDWDLHSTTGLSQPLLFALHSLLYC